MGLGLDAPDGPHVDGGRVVLVLDEELRRAVPSRDHVLGKALVRVRVRARARVRVRVTVTVRVS